MAPETVLEKAMRIAFRRPAPGGAVDMITSGIRAAESLREQARSWHPDVAPARVPAQKPLRRRAQDSK